jgi:hypothetical protein
MTRLLIAFLLLTPTIALGQESDDYKIFVFESNLPDELNHFYSQEIIKNAYSIRMDLNPFFLKGDFDGDKKQDYALSIVERKTNKKGILICHTGTNRHYIIAAGKPLNNGSDDYNWMDAWKVYPHKNVEMGVGEEEKITLTGEAILAMKLESGSGLIYWTGKNYKWYQQSD